ncbi:hypothetical protein Tco_1048724 [Tanacetum coccineum]
MLACDIEAEFVLVFILAGLVKILKKHDKLIGAHILVPFIQQVLKVNCYKGNRPNGSKGSTVAQVLVMDTSGVSPIPANGAISPMSDMPMIPTLVASSFTLGKGEEHREVVKDGVVPSVIVDSGNAANEVVSPSDGSRNNVGPVGDTSIIIEGVTPSMIDMTVEKEKLSSLKDTTVLGSFSPLPTHVTTSAGNAFGKSLYANITNKPSGKKVKVRNLFTLGGNGIDVVVLVDSIRAINENLLKEDVSIVPVWVKLHGVPATAFSEDDLSAIATKLDNIVMAMPKITRDGHYTCNVRVEYEWKPLRCSSCKVFGHIHEECLKNIRAGEKKTMKKPSQTSRGVLNSNPFDVLNLIDNDVEFGINGGTTNLVNNGATTSGSSSMNIDNDGEFASDTPIVSTDIMESDSEVEVVFDETANLKISTSDNNDYDPYDDDMYENHDLSEHLQSICDDFDITVRDRKNK